MLRDVAIATNFWLSMGYKFGCRPIIAVNDLFGKLLNLAPEEVIIELVRAKCIQILLWSRVFSVG